MSAADLVGADGATEVGDTPIVPPPAAMPTDPTRTPAASTAAIVRMRIVGSTSRPERHRRRRRQSTRGPIATDDK